MFSNKSFVSLAVAAAVVAGCGIPKMVSTIGTLEGTGPVKSETRDAKGFDSIRVGGSFELDVKVGPVESVTVEAQENLLKEIQIHTEGSVLAIESEYNLRSDQPIKVTVTTPKLDELTVSGAAQARVEGLSADRFTLGASGAGRVKLAGSVNELKIEESGAADVIYENFKGTTLEAQISGGSSLLASGSVEDLVLTLSGGSQFKGEALQSVAAKVEASGGCQASVNAKESLSGTASGASTVRYKGGAKASLNTSGASTLSQMP